MILSHIVAVSENLAIGVKNDLPWNIPEDLKFFKDKTINSILLMGRKTYESIGRPLPKRTTIVISRTSKPEDYPAGVLLARSIESAIEIARPLSEEENKNEVFIVGGGEIYKQSMSITDKIYLTKIHTKVDGDAYYPAVSEKDFKVMSEKPSGDDKYSYTFYEYERNTSSIK